MERLLIFAPIKTSVLESAIEVYIVEAVCHWIYFNSVSGASEVFMQASLSIDNSLPKMKKQYHITGRDLIL